MVKCWLVSIWIVRKLLRVFVFLSLVENCWRPPLSFLVWFFLLLFAICFFLTAYAYKKWFSVCVPLTHFVFVFLSLLSSLNSTFRVSEFCIIIINKRLLMEDTWLHITFFFEMFLSTLTSQFIFIFTALCPIFNLICVSLILKMYNIHVHPSEFSERTIQMEQHYQFVFECDQMIMIISNAIRTICVYGVKSWLNYLHFQSPIFAFH